MLPKSRRPAREAALRALYELDMGGESVERSLSEMEAFAVLSEDQKEYARRIAAGAAAEMKTLDGLIQENLHDYDLKRVAFIDRNLIRLGAYELLHCPEIPPKVTLNEAIEIAKKYSTAESGRFVNGVLAAILEDSPKRSWEPGAAYEPEEAAEPEPEPDVIEVSEDAPELQEASRVGKWILQSEDPKA